VSHPAQHVRGTSAAATQRTPLRELAVLFLKLGTIAFGGPAAHIAMMEDEVVRRRGWLTREQFLDYLGATNLIPGPNSTEMAIHIGYGRRRWPGLIVAGVCFILPAALIVSGFAWAYVRFGTVPAAAGVLYGVKPVVIAIVVQALWGLGRSAVRTVWLGVLGAGSVLAIVFGAHELVVLAAAGAIAPLAGVVRRLRTSVGGGSLPLLAVVSWPSLRAAEAGGAGGAGGAVAGAAAMSASVGLWPLFGVFVKVGAVLFGSGYVLLAFLRADLVQRFHWLTERQLLDAVAVGQVTPGPVFTTATFIGYVLAGGAGAVIATVGIFLPAFVFVAASGRLVPRLRRSPTAGAVLDGINVASLALMAVVTWHLGRAALVDWSSMALALVSALVLLRYRVNSAWLVLAGGIVGVLLEGS
jgi:chromate transporter